MRALAALACGVLSATAAGCSATPEEGGSEGLRVYLSSPLRGPLAEQGRAIRDGARLALRERAGGPVGVDHRFLDDSDGAASSWSAAATARNARRATSDSAAVAYIGELSSGATRVSLPITNGARLAQVSAAGTAPDLVAPFPGSDEVPELTQPSGERSFARVIPDDRVQARAGAAWAGRLGARTALVVSDGSEFGDALSGEFAEAAAEGGIALIDAGGPRVERDTNGAFSGPPAALARVARAERPQLVYYGGEPQRALPTLRHVAEAAPGATIMASDALLLDARFLARAGPLESRLALTAAAQDPRQLPAEGRRLARRYRSEYGRPPDPYAAYGYEAAALLLDAIDRAAEADGAVDRGAVVEEMLATRDRRSVLGTYSIDEVGDTTLDRLSAYRVRDGKPAFAAPLRAP